MTNRKNLRTEDGVKNVGLWVRVSTEDQAHGDSPEVHEKRARMYAESRGWNVAQVYKLEAVSGKAVMQHPEAQRMLGDLRAGRISGLIFSKLARLARNTRELLDFADEFRAVGADMISLQEAIDTGSPAGRLFFTIIAAMATWEREEIASRVAASVPIRAKMGKPTGGQAPFGYRWLGKKLVPDPNEAPVRVLMYQLFAEHKRRRTVARILNDRGYRTRNGSKWSDTSVLRLLQDTTAKGIHRANYTRTDDRRKTWELKPESEWVLNEVEAIVEEGVWEECNRLLAGRTRRPRQSRKAVHLFAGFAECGGCGGKMYVWSNSPKYVCTKCKNRIAVADLEAIYKEQLTQYLVSPEEIEAHFATADDAVAEKTHLVSAAEDELKKLQAEDDRLYKLYVAEQLSAEDFGRRHKPLTERRTQVQDELPRLQAELDALRISRLSTAEAITEARSLASHWPDMTREEKRQIIEVITDRIVIKDNEIEIDLMYQPAPFRNQSTLATQPHGFIAATS